ncbi:unnamed protein product [Phytomonas sp. Hart1]|nr:unnamed protein product [Phytomonas sp. Hart1]|eukprot:CCW70913.1 unnamed protein product [Phytomonas sp. isolate Hart1]
MLTRQPAYASLTRQRDIRANLIEAKEEEGEELTMVKISRVQGCRPPSRLPPRLRMLCRRALSFSKDNPNLTHPIAWTDENVMRLQDLGSDTSERVGGTLEESASSLNPLTLQEFCEQLRLQLVELESSPDMYFSNSPLNDSSIYGDEESNATFQVEINPIHGDTPLSASMLDDYGEED